MVYRTVNKAPLFLAGLIVLTACFVWAGGTPIPTATLQPTKTFTSTFTANSTGTKIPISTPTITNTPISKTPCATPVAITTPIFKAWYLVPLTLMKVNNNVFYAPDFKTAVKDIPIRTGVLTATDGKNALVLIKDTDDILTYLDISGTATTFLADDVTTETGSQQASDALLLYNQAQSLGAPSNWSYKNYDLP